MARRFAVAAVLATAGCAADPAPQRKAAHEFAPAPMPVCLRGSYVPKPPSVAEYLAAGLAGAATSQNRRIVENEARRKSCGCSVC